ncbi:hypothetical protein B0H21DRAFT_710569 [Amylocystis lapponica]|nr:hypothetical protein B0H21DRAFT_710569 [Amylocystis lapponica]
MPNVFAILYPSIWKECSVEVRCPRPQLPFASFRAIVEGDWAVPQYQRANAAQKAFPQTQEADFHLDTMFNPIWADTPAGSWASHGQRIPADDPLAHGWASLPNIMVKPKPSHGSSLSFDSSSSSSSDPLATPTATHTSVANERLPAKWDKAVGSQPIVARRPLPAVPTTTRKDAIPSGGLSSAQKAELETEWATFVRETLIPARRAAQVPAPPAEPIPAPEATVPEDSLGAARKAEREAEWDTFVRETLIPARRAVALQRSVRRAGVCGGV